MRELVEYVIWGCLSSIVIILFLIIGANYCKSGQIVFAIMCLAVIAIALIPIYLLVKELINYYHDKRNKNNN
jgi:hypothetical protein